MHREEGATLHRKIAADLAATHPEVVYDPYSVQHDRLRM